MVRLYEFNNEIKLDYDLMDDMYHYMMNDDDFYRNKHRVSINKKVIQKYNPKIIELNSFGNSKLEKTLFLVNLTDWISWFLYELNNVDAIEIDVINFLKSELSKIN